MTLHRENKDGSYNIRGYGGAREGSGRKPTGRRKVQLWITPDEETYLRLQLETYRADNGVTFIMSTNP